MEPEGREFSSMTYDHNDPTLAREVAVGNDRDAP
jgi:hypothetical protein